MAKLNPLDRVREKAKYNYHKRLRQAEEDRKFKEALDSGQPFEAEESQPKQTEQKKGNK